MPTPWNNPYIPGDPFSYDLKWIVTKIKEHTLSIQQIIDTMPDDAKIREVVQQMLDDGTLSTMFLNDLGIVNVKDFGAKGDGFADDHDAIMAAYIKAADINGLLYFPAGDYVISSGLVMETGVHVMMDGVIHYSGTGPAVEMGNASGVVSFKKQNWKIEGISGINSGSVGLSLINMSNCDVTLDYINNFEKCVVCKGDGEGFADNIVTCNFIGRYTDGLTLTSANSGWCNENLFIGGRFFKSNLASWQTKAIVITSDGSRYQNNNVFIKPNCETNNEGIVLDYANYNTVTEARFENVTTPITVNNNSQNNKVTAAYGVLTNIPEINLAVEPQLYVRENHEKNELIFGDFAGRCASNASNGSVEDFYIMTNNGAKNYYLAGFDCAPVGDGTKVQAGRLFGAIIPIETDGTKVVHFDALTTEKTERGMFQMLDENDAVITTPPGFFSAQSATNTTFGSTSAFLFSNNPDGYNFIPPASCKKLFVGIYTTADVTLRRVRVTSKANIYEIKHKATLTAIPTTTGSYVGQRVVEFQGSNEWIWSGNAWKTITLS